MLTLAQLSYALANRLGDTGLKAMQERGRVRVGKVADLHVRGVTVDVTGQKRTDAELQERREQEVLAQVLRGRLNKQIAAEAGAPSPKGR